MTDKTLPLLVATIRKLYNRQAIENVENILLKTHSADIAALLAHFPLEERLDIFRLPVLGEKRPEIFSFMELHEQEEFLSELPKEEIFDLVGRLESDDAADILGRIKHDQAKEILDSLEKESSQEVVELMTYPKDSAGGLMSSDYFALHQDLTVDQAIASLQSGESDNIIAFYLYVVNENERFVGVLSLKQLVLAKKGMLLKDIMLPDVISVRVDTHKEQVAKIVEKYDFLSIPVVDHNNELSGVITVDDVLDVIREQAEGDLLAVARAGWGLKGNIWQHFRARMPWLLLSFWGGILAFLLFFILTPVTAPMDFKLGSFSPKAFWMVVSVLPLFIAMSTTLSGQVASVTIGALRSGQFGTQGGWSFVGREFALNCIQSVLLVGLFSAWIYWVFPSTPLFFPLVVSFGTQLFLTWLTGICLPLMMQSFQMDPRVSSIPLLSLVADITAVLVLFVICL